jgi:hypothetical protein
MFEGRTDELGAEFTYHHKDVHYFQHRVTEFVPGKKVVWLLRQRPPAELYYHRRRAAQPAGDGDLAEASLGRPPRPATIVG